MKTNECDFLIIGSGLAGLTAAMHLSRLGEVHILSKGQPDETNTSMAQGGISSVSSSEDSFLNHIKDTLTAGAGLCHANVVRSVIEQAPDCIRQLQDWGVQFDQDSLKKMSLTREGGHNKKRILHVKDQTGKAIHTQLLQVTHESPHIKFFSNYTGIDLILDEQIKPSKTHPASCIGCYALDTSSQEVIAWKSKITILATGGVGKAYLYTSNWSGSTGDGIAMGFRAGTRIANMEFMQFHPTCLHHPEARNFLISETLRGEGACLINSQGHKFMDDHHALAELAPRDIVARGITAEIRRTGDSCVFLDITHKPAGFLKTRFPVIYKRCLQYGIDLTTDPIPVIPAAHYLCGGLVSNEVGQTDIQGLFALGETACTGLHGANRLASNSLLECVAYAHNTYKFLQKNIASFPLSKTDIKNWTSLESTNDDELLVISQTLDEIRHLMWNYVGIIRSNKKLSHAQSRLDNIIKETKTYYGHFQLSQDLIELKNIALVAKLTVESALRRQESIGIHYNIDAPRATDSKSHFSDTIILPGQF